MRLAIYTLMLSLLQKGYKTSRVIVTQQKFVFTVRREAFTLQVATTRAILVDRQRDCSEGEGHRAPVNSRIVSPADSSSAAEGPSLMRLSPHHIRSSSSSDVSLE